MSALSRRLGRRARRWNIYRSCDEDASYLAWRFQRTRVLRVGEKHGAGKYPYAICGTCGHVAFGRRPLDLLSNHRAIHGKRSRRRQHDYRMKRRGGW